MASSIGLIQRVLKASNPPTVAKAAGALKFGILGAANIAPEALLKPARSHPDVVVHAVAARSLVRAQAFAQKHGIAKSYGSYDELLNDPDINVIYNPLPNGLHYEWTLKALAAGKHVLLEKPSANTAAETQRMFEFAAEKGLVLMEAFHYRFHPAVQRARDIVASGELGAVKSVDATLLIPAGIITPGDIRYDYSLGGGAFMDVGCYTMHVARCMAGCDPTEVLSTTTHPGASGTTTDARIDGSGSVSLAFGPGVTGTLNYDMSYPRAYGVLPRIGFRVEVVCAGGSMRLTNFIAPALWHSIAVTTKKEGAGKEAKRVEKVYTPADGGKGEAWWSTYRYQLEAFVDRVRGRAPPTWITAEDSVANMRWIENVYAKAGLGSRPESGFVLP